MRDNLFGRSINFLFDTHDLFVFHGREDDYSVCFAFKIEEKFKFKTKQKLKEINLRTSLKILTDCTRKAIRNIRELDVFAAVSLFVHQSGKTIRGNVNESVLYASNDRDKHGISGRANLFVFLVGKNIHCGKVTLGGSVLSSLGGGNSRHLFVLFIFNKEEEKFDNIKTFTLQGWSLMFMNLI
jgi:hypothetical protein